MTNCISLAPEFEQALRRLCGYLLGGQLQAAFDMSLFNDEQDLEPEERTRCGSVGCAIGHGPEAGLEKHLGEDWLEYSERVFGLTPGEPAWHWCFDCEWSQSDNTPQGAAKRILWLLEHGLPDEPDRLGQRFGTAPLCYAGMEVWRCSTGRR